MRKIEDKLIRVKPNGKGWSVYRNDQPVEFLNQNYFFDQISAEQAAKALRSAQLRSRIETIIRRQFFAAL